MGVLLSISVASVASAEWFTETLYKDWAQSFEIQNIVFEEETEHQSLKIFDTPFYGRVLALDGIIQLTEKDEFTYHEMLTHVPILTHGHIRNVLIIGGGDGGILREVTKHAGIEKITLVELDASVIELSKTYLPFMSQGAFDDSRVEICIQDGYEYVQNAHETYDLIICDTTDPIGPAEILFSKAFLKGCKRLLASGGLLVTQNGVPFLQQDELLQTDRIFRELFSEHTFFTTVVPTYVGGFMTFGWACNGHIQHPTLSVIKQRHQKLEGKVRYYTPEIHRASFALPQCILNMLSENTQ